MLGPTLVAVPSRLVVAILMIGARTPMMRLKEDARASPVPR